MPSRIYCPACNTAFAFSPALSGKTVRCKQCSNTFAVDAAPTDAPPPATSSAPRQQPLVPPPLPPKAKVVASRRPTRRDDFEEDERPRPRRRPAAAPERSSGAGALIGLIALFVVGFLILAVGIGYLLWPRSPATQTVAQGPAPASDPMTPIEAPRGLDQILKDRPNVPVQPIAPPNLPPEALPGFPELPVIPPAQPPLPRPRFPGRPVEPAMNALPAPSFAPITPLPIKATPVTRIGEERAMPGPIQSIAVAGGGRLLLLHLPRERKVAVFDVNTGQRVKYVAAEDDRAKIAGGMNVFVVYSPGKNLLERYNCSTLEREGEVNSAFPADVLALAMGNSSNGPLVAALGGSRRTFHGGATLGYFDPSTGKELGYEKAGEENPFGLGLHDLTKTGVRVSSDGTVVAGFGGPAPQVDVLDGGRIMRYWRHGGPDGITVAADGHSLFARGERFSQDLNPVGDRAPGMPEAIWFVPAVHGDFFMSIRAMDDRRGAVGIRRASADVYLGTEGRAFWHLNELLNLEVPNGFDARGRTLDQNVLLIPEAKLLVVIPTKTRDRLLMYKADLDAALAKADFEYFFITSKPATLAVKGESYTYTLTAKSKKGGIKVALESGPKGMNVTPVGVLSWDVPKSFADSQAVVILKATDASGKELFQSFRLNVMARSELPSETKAN